jgi:hypothetical protein
VARLALDDLAAFAAELPAATFAGDWRGLVADMRDASRRAALWPPSATWPPHAERRAWFTGSRVGLGDRAAPGGAPGWKGLGGPREPPRPPAAARQTHLARRPWTRWPWASSTRGPPPAWPSCARPWPGSTAGADDDALDHLAGNLLGGGGDQGLFMQTWAAGLAYSNGIRPRERTGVLRYYAERCPRPRPRPSPSWRSASACAPATDAGRARMALVTALGGDRSAQGYGERTRQRALETAVGRHRAGSAAPRRPGGTATAPAAWRTSGASATACSEAARRDGLPELLERRKMDVHARLFPGLAKGSWTAPTGTQLFFLGPERQLDLVDGWLAPRAAGLRVHRVAPRDYWVREARP